MNANIESGGSGRRESMKTDRLTCHKNSQIKPTKSRLGNKWYLDVYLSKDDAHT